MSGGDGQDEPEAGHAYYLAYFIQGIQYNTFPPIFLITLQIMHKTHSLRYFYCL